MGDNLFYLQWKDNRALLEGNLAKNILDSLSNGNLKVLSSKSLSESEKDKVRARVTEVTMKRLNTLINDSHFLLHVILSSGIFLVTFYFLAVVIKDPLPYVDEFIGALCLALLGWFRLRSQNAVSEKALRLKQEYAHYIETISFEQSSFIEEVEFYLEGSVRGQGQDFNTLFRTKIDQVLLLSLSLEGRSKKIRHPDLKGLKKDIKIFLKDHSSIF